MEGNESAARSLKRKQRPTMFTDKRKQTHVNIAVVADTRGPRLNALEGRKALPVRRLEGRAIHVMWRFGARLSTAHQFIYSTSKMRKDLHICVR